MKIKSISVILFVILIFCFSLFSCSSGPKYVGRYEICGFGAFAFYLNEDGTTSNGKGSTNGGIKGNWEKTSNGITITGMGNNWDGDYQLDGSTDGVTLKRGNLRYCNPSYR
jgi:hypothetical protein